MNGKNRQIKNRRLRLIPAAVCMLMIFWMSDRPAVESSVQSGGITMSTIRIISGVSEMSEAEQEDLALVLEPYIRNTAHIIEYAVLFFAVLFAVSAFSSGILRASFISLLICFLYAITDEWHQMFVPGRAVQTEDIVMDTAGALLAMALYLLIRKWRRLYCKKGEIYSKIWD